MKVCQMDNLSDMVGMIILKSGCAAQALLVECCKITEGMADETKEYSVVIFCLGKINRKITRELRKNGIDSEEKFLGHGGHRLIVKNRTGVDVIPILEKIKI